MKGKILIILMALLFAVPAFAQKHHSDKDREERKKEMMEFKMNFIAQEIDLKEDQKKQFTILYTQMETERRAIFKRIKKAEKSISENTSASEADYEKASKEITAARAEMAQLEKQYDEKFATFLTAKQMYKLKEAENKFTQKMQECRDKKKQERKK